MKEFRISARLPEDLKKRLEAAEKKLGIDQALIARKCIEALVEYVEEHGEITFPLEIAPKRKRPNPSEPGAPINYRQRPKSVLLNEPGKKSKKEPPTGT